jgi:osmotically-inducible protein OsmY
MRLLTLVALATLAAGAYHFQKSRGQASRRPPSDTQQARRVRAAIESAVANPGEVDVRMHGGTVTLRGRVRKEERDFVLAAALGAPGVTEVRNYLEIDEPAGDIGTMQSGIATGV